MSVSKTNRSASAKAQEALPAKDGSSFKKALKSASDKKTASEEKPNGPVGADEKRLAGKQGIADRVSGERLDGERLKGEELSGESKIGSFDNDVLSSEKVVKPGTADDASIDDSRRELDEVSLDDAFSDEDAFDEEPMISVDGSWGSPAEGLVQPGAIITPTPAAPAPPAQVMQHLVSAMAAEGWVGADIHGKKVVMLNVECPGRGSVRIRLRQEESGVSVRVRADNDELSDLLETHQDQLRDAMSKKGLSLANLEVAS